jgi:D-glycero-alpha-D-manno-heptose-7-phosphate kinase
MIISRTPFRVSLFGGGTDYPSWFENNSPGSVISFSINKYSYLLTRPLPPFFDYNYRIRYYKKEEVKKISDIEHPTVRESLKFFKLHNKKIDISHMSDLPAQSGLGSSSSFTVGLIHSLSTMNNIYKTKKELAYDAIKIENDILKENIGCQDQVACSFGGLNQIKFEKNRTITVEQIFLTEKNLEKFQESLFLVFTNLQRNANKTAAEQITRIQNHKNDEYLNEITQITKYANEEIFFKKKIDLDKLGEALNQQWSVKKKLADNITNHTIDRIYNSGIKNGAIGGKLLGAGNGGFFIFVVKKKNQKKFLDSFKKSIVVHVKIDTTGSQIIYYKQ